MRKLWLAFAAVLIVSFSILGYVGVRIGAEMPPIPDRVVTEDGTTLITPGEITAGQEVWRTLGGMEVGSIWGHGSYVAPDWTADWLHRESTTLLDIWANAERPGARYADLEPERQAALRERLQIQMRTNRYDPATGTLTISSVRAQAYAACAEELASVFREGREAYAIPAGALTDPTRLKNLAAFVFWTSWAASTNRPGQDISYTQNWPHEPLVGNRPTGESIVWTGVSVILLLAGIGAMVWWYAATHNEEPPPVIPAADPLSKWATTPSQKVTLFYFAIVAALFILQIVMGVVTAHFGVEGDGFYGIPLSAWLPYAVTRTWHVQLGLFWIATAWLAAGLFIGPLVSGKEPRFQAPFAWILLAALVVIVVGSLAGQWLSIHNKLSDDMAFHFGHQGYEYVDLGRVWQIGLFAGLLIWLAMVFRASLPALRANNEGRQLLALFLVSATAIGLFYGAGLMWGRKTHLSLVEYWRWWVIHLWVEGFFEVFATTVIAFLFTTLGLVRPRFAAQAALLSATIYLSGGIIGTCHHLYFSGTPSLAMAWGAVFSALEVVPLVMVAYSALDDLRMSRSAQWVAAYKWPIAFFLSVAFWNLVGAGLFGFMINPPIALYFMQGLNTTPVHGHAALFGVYGMLGIGLTLVCLRASSPRQTWPETWLSVGFWSMNLGLFAMCVVSLLPLGLIQTWAAVEKGYWYARSAEFLNTPVLDLIRWLRVPGDTLFAIGAIAIALFILKQTLPGIFGRGQRDERPSPREHAPEPVVKA